MQCLSYMMNFTENYFCIICGDLNSDINKAQKSERAGTLYNKYLIGVSLTQLSYQDEKNRCIHLEISLIDYILIPDFARFNSLNVMIENSVPFEVSDHLRYSQHYRVKYLLLFIQDLFQSLNGRKPLTMYQTEFDMYLNHKWNRLIQQRREKSQIIL